MVHLLHTSTLARERMILQVLAALQKHPPAQVVKNSGRSVSPSQCGKCETQTAILFSKPYVLDRPRLIRTESLCWYLSREVFKAAVFDSLFNFLRKFPFRLANLCKEVCRTRFIRAYLLHSRRISCSDPRQPQRCLTRRKSLFHESHKSAKGGRNVSKTPLRIRFPDDC